MKTHKVLRSSEVNRSVEEGDTRLYYCDTAIDFVYTTITKPMISEPHKHSRNTETYYVFRGKLTLHVEDTSIELGPGDMAVVYPESCHRFETADEEVVFCAIKKEPLLDDKESC